MELLPLASNLILLAFGSFLITMAIAYAWWGHLRTLFLRQELFLIRDRLWEFSREHGSFEDPAYKQIREHLNATIRSAGILSIPALEAWIRINEEAGVECVSKQIKTNDEALAKAIADAYDKSAKVINRYIIHYTFCGLWMYYGAKYGLLKLKCIKTDRKKSRRERVEKVTRTWIQSEMPERFARFKEEGKELCGSTN